MTFVYWCLSGLISVFGFIWCLNLRYNDPWTYSDIAWILLMAVFGPMIWVALFAFGLVAVVIWIFEQPFWRKPIFKEKK